MLGYNLQLNIKKKNLFNFNFISYKFNDIPTNVKL